MSLLPSQILKQHRAEIKRIVESHRATNVRVFGSVLPDEDTVDSDLDLLVDALPNATLFDFGAIYHGLRTLLKIPVDVVTP